MERDSRIKNGAKVTLLALAEWAKKYFTWGMPQETIAKYSTSNHRVEKLDAYIVIYIFQVKPTCM